MDFVKHVELFLWHMKRKSLIDAESLLAQMSEIFWSIRIFRVVSFLSSPLSPQIFSFFFLSNLFMREINVMNIKFFSALEHQVTAPILVVMGIYLSSLEHILWWILHTCLNYLLLLHREIPNNIYTDFHIFS